MKKDERISIFLRGLRDGLPIGAGYFAVAFGLGIAAQRVGMSPLQGYLMSFFNHASAGEYAGVAAIRSEATYIATALLIIIANARYLLMSTALSQKLSPDLPIIHRILVGFGITDEIFGLGIAFAGNLSLLYLGTAFLLADLMWSAGTMLGIIAGNILPAAAVSALSVAIYGMFLAIIIPPARKSRVIAGVVAVSFACSFMVDRFVSTEVLPEGIRVILLTVAIASGAAALFPVPEENDRTGGDRA